MSSQREQNSSQREQSSSCHPTLLKFNFITDCDIEYNSSICQCGIQNNDNNPFSKYYINTTNDNIYKFLKSNKYSEFYTDILKNFDVFIRGVIYPILSNKYFEIYTKNSNYRYYLFIPLYYFDTFMRQYKDTHKKLFTGSLKNSDKFITDTEYFRDSMAKNGGWFYSGIYDSILKKVSDECDTQKILPYLQASIEVFQGCSLDDIDKLIKFYDTFQQNSKLIAIIIYNSLQAPLHTYHRH